MARLNVRDMWAAKLAGGPMPAAKAAPTRIAGLGTGAGVAATFSLQRAPFVGVVLGIDPSLRGTGLALIEFAPSRQPVLLRCRTLKIPSSRPMSYALGEIHKAVAAFLVDFKVRHVALEQTIYVQNFQTAQILGAARGAAISAAALGGMDVFEYAPLRVKQAVTGAGRASKEQLARTVMAMLGHGAVLAADEADAAGVALCHAFTWRE
ncbi:MAG: crossover junction endodeoxyribonuclease RuvC [Opitutus sp.]|nr:crossover junction endodeoxyribonuclease RuvC [Opitutus sp.]MCS6247190.1 crossover junction endodeoxyribonuclease RuvC [Opitutus sp.]MCS6274067.1 crossover junction endodeoxyribonuclease RuvC [Opitutus sp.]MCS6276343.1 crossover junction endodeoxyribonuclease RuvC [Opitutus sp.]MCS6302009.1 crossover junction endodeoxyribonuclease RuvC [Opitutus sp.]